MFTRLNPDPALEKPGAAIYFIAACTVTASPFTLTTASRHEEPSSPSAGNPSPSAFKKTKLAGPIAGGVIGGLLLCSALAFLANRARCQRQTRNPVFVDGIDAAPVKQPLPARGSGPSAIPGLALPHEEWTPAPNQDASSHLPPAVLAMEDKTAQHLSAIPRQEEVAQRAETLQQQARGLTDAVSAPRQPLDAETGARLLAEMRMLRERVDELQQAQRPPEYTPGSS
ncbi:hypothetical protein DFH09DRAFT_1307355 [Mycena vulgaris]|nr:hypothetical protein DFH09DRAFT_1307355 [Mycena vulgaris]